MCSFPLTSQLCLGLLHEIPLNMQKCQFYVRTYQRRHRLCFEIMVNVRVTDYSLRLQIDVLPLCALRPPDLQLWMWVKDRHASVE